MSRKTAPAVYTIPPHRAFADALVSGVLATHGDDRMAMARGIILVPNNRAGLSIRDAFVRRSEGGLLLPRLVTVGDVESDEGAGLVFDGGRDWIGVCPVKHKPNTFIAFDITNCHQSRQQQPTL